MKSSILQVTPGINRATAIILWAMLLCAASQARAATPTYYWDANGSADGAGDPPTGDWFSTSTNWTLDFYGTSPTFYYANRANIVFAATGNDYWWQTPDDYTVTVHGIAQVSDIVFKDGNCTLTTVAPYYLKKDTPFISVLGDGQEATMNSVIASMDGTSNGITKFAFGTLVLGATNTYRGPTTIKGGTLRLAAPQVLPNTSTLVLAGGDNRPNDYYTSTPPTFDTGGYNQTLGPLRLTGPNSTLPHTIDFGHGASALAFANSNTQDWGGILLYLANFKPGVDSLRFGTNNSGLSASQLALLRFTSSLEVPGRIDANGFVTPAPPPTLSITRGNPTGMKITWDAISGRFYNLQYRANPTTAAWITNAITDIVATNTTVSYTDNPGTNRQRFYRVRLKAISEGT